MTVHIDLPPETESELRERAARLGKDLSSFVREAVEEKLAASPDNGTLSLAEFDHVLDELGAESAGLPPLPADFSRADVYASHD